MIFIVTLLFGRLCFKTLFSLDAVLIYFVLEPARVFCLFPAGYARVSLNLRPRNVYDLSDRTEFARTGVAHVYTWDMRQYKYSNYYYTRKHIILSFQRILQCGGKSCTSLDATEPLFKTSLCVGFSPQPIVYSWHWNLPCHHVVAFYNEIDSGEPTDFCSSENAPTIRPVWIFRYY